MSRERLRRWVFWSFSVQKRKCRRGPVEAPATAATRAPSGAASVPLPLKPRENILSNTMDGFPSVSTLNVTSNLLPYVLQ